MSRRTQQHPLIFVPQNATLNHSVFLVMFCHLQNATTWIRVARASEEKPRNSAGPKKMGLSNVDTTRSFFSFFAPRKMPCQNLNQALCVLKHHRPKKLPGHGNEWRVDR